MRRTWFDLAIELVVLVAFVSTVIGFITVVLADLV